MEWKDKRAEEYRKLLERAKEAIGQACDTAEYSGVGDRNGLEILWRDIHNALKPDAPKEIVLPNTRKM